MKKAIKLLFSGIFLLLGLIGLAIPVIPQVPFFVISAVLAASASERIRDKIKSTRIYKKTIRNAVLKNEALSKVFDEKKEYGDDNNC